MVERNHPCVLLNSTNVLPQVQGRSPPTLPEDVPSKRRPPTPDGAPTKRPRLTRQGGHGEASDDDADSFIPSTTHRHPILSLLQKSSWCPPSSSPRIMRMHPSLYALPSAHSCLYEVPSRPILQSFVSSHRYDGFRCTSLAAHTFLTPPYACAYSHGKRIHYLRESHSRFGYRCQAPWYSPSCCCHRRRLCINPRYFQTSRMGFRYAAYLQFSNA